MTRKTLAIRLLLPAVAALPLLAACSSGNNNKNKNSNSSAPVASASAVTTVASTPAAAIATPRSAVATPSGIATPSRGAASSTPSIGAALATAAAVAQGTPTDQALEAQLKTAILQESDLPSGFSQQDTDDTVDTSAGMTANYSATFTKIGQGSGGLDIQAIVVDLAGFKDTATAQSNFKDLQQQIQQGAGADIQLTPVTTTSKVGDDTVAFKVGGVEQGITIGGYAVIWRHGRLAGAIVQVGAPGPQTIDQTTQLAQAQDKKLGAVH